ncbi:hypothetical protein ACQ4N7_28445 [Nodosilinea sp. AN01ver1]|uniref:hypothetical protein n=1 Tax=Nodosilinea sp. AN01ver1 TaxID=3423362 RepID=UPI003D315036
MATPTLTQQSAIAQLADAQQRHELLSVQFSRLQSQLSGAEVGTVEFTDAATRAATLKTKLTALTGEIRELEQAAKSEQQTRKEQDAAAALAAAELERQLKQDEQDVDAAIARINNLSDQLDAALSNYFENCKSAKARLDAARMRRFSELAFDSRSDRGKLPWIQASAQVANRTSRDGRKLLGWKG